MSVSKENSRASVRQEVQPALSPSGLRVQAAPTGVTIPRGDYRPRVSADVQVISQAFDRLSQTASSIAREEIKERAKKDESLGIQFRLEAGDNANRDTDVEGQSEDWINGYDTLHGRLGAARANAELKAIYKNNPDLYVTQGMLQNLFAERIQTDLEGVESETMRAAYIQGIIPGEANLVAENAAYQQTVAHTEQVNAFADVVKDTFTSNIEGKDAQAIATDRTAMVELGRLNGLSKDETNEIIVKTVGEQAVALGRPELLEAFDMTTQDIEDPDVTIPPMSTSKKFRDVLTEYKKAAVRQQKAFERDQLEVRQNNFFKALDAEPNAGVKVQMIDKAVENGTISAEKADEKRRAIRKQKVTTDVHNAAGDLLVNGNYAGLEGLVAGGYMKESEMNAMLDKHETNLLTHFHENKDNPDTMVQAEQSIRKLARDINGTGHDSKVLKRELNPAIDDRGAFENSVFMYNKLRAQGADGRAVAASHSNADQKGRMRLYENFLKMGYSGDEAYEAARSYGSVEAIKQGNELIGTKRNAMVSTAVEDELSEYDPWGWTSYDMANLGPQKALLEDVARVRVQQSGGRLQFEDELENVVEEFKDSHTPYLPNGSDVGQWVETPQAVDQGEFQDAFDYYGRRVANELGLPEETGFYPTYQAGIGYVVHEADSGRPVVRKGPNGMTIPVTFQNPQHVIEAYQNQDLMTKEEAIAAQAEGQKDVRPWQPRGRGATAARRKAQKRELEAAQKEILAADPDRAVPQAVPEVAPVEATPLAAEGGMEDISFIRTEENNKVQPFELTGWDKQKELWTPHKSPEGGNKTLAYGHKLTNPERDSGYVIIAGEKVNYKDGITDAQAEALLKQDTEKARKAINESVTVPLNDAQRAALTSLVFNAGIKSWKKSRALKALNAGDMDEFRKQAFSEEHGWTKAAGERNKVLVERRQREEQLFFGK